MKHIEAIKRVFAVCTIVLATASSIRAQNGTDGSGLDLMDLSLDELLNLKIEAATKTDITQIEVPQAITILNRTDIEKIPANNLGELLRSVVGANVVRVQTSQNVLGARGSNDFAPSKILILIDGQPIDPTLFSTTWWELVPVSLNDIERIEFIRSPGTIYGANAQNGVVNIITQTLSTDNGRRHKIKAAVKSGQQNLQQQYVGYLGKVGGVSYRFSTEFYRVNAYYRSERLEIIPGKLSKEGEQTFQSSKNLLNLQNFSGALQANVFGNVLNANVGFKNINNAQGRVPDRLCFIGIDGFVNYANLKYSFNSSDAQNTITLGNDVINYKFLRNSDKSRLDPAEMTLNKLRFGYELQKNLGTRHNLLFGLEYGLETAKNVSGVPFFASQTVSNRSLFSSYVQDEWKLTERDRLYAGGLFSNHYISGANFAPMLALVHKLDNRNVIRLATYTSYRNPNVFEHSMDYDQTSGAGGKRTRLKSNPELKAERTTSYEIGFRSQAGENFFFSVDFYLNRIANGIEWTLVGFDTVPSPRPQYRSENTLQQTIGGAEITMKYQLHKNFSFENNLSFTSISNKSSRPEYQGAFGKGPNNVGQGRFGAQYVPPYIYNAILQYKTRRVSFDLQYQYTAAHTWQWPHWDAKTHVESLTLKPVPAYGLVNAYAGFNIVKNLRLAVEGYNLFNKYHTEWRGDKSYFGRTVWASLNIQY